MFDTVYPVGMTTDKFQPDWASPPGDTLKDLLHDRAMTVDDLAARTGLPGGFLGLLVAGEAELVADVAVQLERVFGTPSQFWIRREEQFRAALKRQVEAIAAEAAARGLSATVVSERADLPQPYVEKVLAQTTYFAPWVVDHLRRAVSNPEPWFEEQQARLAALATTFPKGKVLFRENWTTQDWENERDHRAEVDATAARRRSVLLERGWKVFRRRSTERGACAVRSWAIDPLNGVQVLEEEAFAIQERREPGSVEPWPARQHPVPPTTQKMIDLPEHVEIKPLERPLGLIFYMETSYGESK